MADRNNWERERMRDRGPESNRENWGRREDWRDEDRERESQYAGGEGRFNEGRFNEGRFNEGRYPEGRFNEGRFNEGRYPEGRFNEGRGYSGGQESRGFEGSRGYTGNFPGRDYDAYRAYESSRGGYQGSRGDYETISREAGRGDYGPGAFNRQFRTGTELYGTGQRGYGTTWGGAGSTGYTSGYGYGGGQSAYSGGLGTYGEQGRFSGRGPKGYTRSDDRIREDVCERLTQHPDIDASDIEIQVKNAEVTLTGTVDRRDEKRMAEDVAESVYGVKDVHNQLRAQQQGVMAGQGTHTQGSKSETGGATVTKTK
jgi:hypothetical protein